MDPIFARSKYFRRLIEIVVNSAGSVGFLLLPPLYYSEEVHESSQLTSELSIFQIIDGHKVTVKESTYVSDQDGIKSVIHLSEVDLAGDSNESDGDKPKTSTPKFNEDESPEDKDDKEDEGKDNEDEDKEDDKPKEESSTTDAFDEDKTEKQTPEVEISKPTTEEPASKNIEDNETSDNNNSEENHVKTNRHPDSEVEEIDTDGDNYYNYKYNTVGKVRAIEPKEVGKKKFA